MPHYRARRQRLMASIAEGLLILPAGEEKIRSADTYYPFRPDSDFFYLTGFAEPDAVLVLDATAKRSILFCRPKDPERERWEGARLGVEAACDVLGMDEAHDVADLFEYLPKLFAGKTQLLWHLGRSAFWDEKLMALCAQSMKSARQGQIVPSNARAIAPEIAKMRQIKDEHELALMRRAADISARAHQRAMRAVRPNMPEWELEAELQHEFMRSGARFAAYASIVAGGDRACVLHYTANDQLLRDGDLVLIDAGCEYGFYAGDITRTFPVNGKFSEPQRQIYELVLRAQEAAIAKIRPGVCFAEVGDAARDVLILGLIDLGILSGTLAENIENQAYKAFYMHSIGHWLGLDVHDVGAYYERCQSICLRAGMVLTVEPGLYLSAGVPDEFLGIGVRIEDDVLVTEDGAEILTSSVPKTVAAIEAWMAADV